MRAICEMIAAFTWRCFNQVEFWRRFIIIIKVWVHHFIIEMKQLTQQSTGKGESVPKKAKTVPSAG